MKNNKNRAKLVINNKKYKLKELVNDIKVPEKNKDDKLKINLILCKELSNIRHGYLSYPNYYTNSEILFLLLLV